jgi:hypothetical protein
MNVLILSEFQSLGFEGVLGYNKGGERGKEMEGKGTKGASRISLSSCVG